jgi:CheY-like chemotaxis protein
MESVFDELVQLMGPVAPDRFAVDPVLPFLDGGPASGAGVAALAGFLARLNATTLVTYPGDLRERYDRRLEPLVQHCAAVLHLSAYGEGVARMDVVKVRRRLWSESPAFFGIRAGRGVVPLDGDGAREPTSDRARFRRQILLFQGVDGLPEEFLSRLESAYAVSVHAGATPEVPEVLPPDVGAALLAARWDAIEEATTFLRRLRHLGNRTPVILVTRGDVRSADRAHALLAGFDEVIPDSFGAEEFVARVVAVVRRGRSATVPVEIADAGSTFGGSPDDAAPAVIDEESFRATLAAARDGSAAPLSSVVFLAPQDGELGALVNLVARTMRAASGDVAAVVADRVAVYLPGTRRTDVAPFVRRVSDAWRRSGCGELRVAQFALPADADRLRADLRPAASSVHDALEP